MQARKVVLLVLIFAVSRILPAQDTIPAYFYKHFEGTLGDAMAICLELHRFGDELSGSYYYYFKDPGNREKSYHYGKTIPLEGSIHSKGDLELREFSEMGSVFKGKFVTASSISGIWSKSAGSLPLVFSISEQYGNGSLPLRMLHLTDSYCPTSKTASGPPPCAGIKLSLLVSYVANNALLIDSVNRQVYRYLETENTAMSPENILTELKDQFFTYYKTAIEGIQDLAPASSFSWSKEITMHALHNERNFLTLQFSKYVFTGGSHGLLMHDYLVMDLESGKKLRLEDLFIPGYQDELTALINKAVRNMYSVKPEESLKERGFFTDLVEPHQNFYINSDGIGFYYNYYMISSYANGPTDVFIPFSDLKGILTGRYQYLTRIE
jgi:hypothetical protein